MHLGRDMFMHVQLANEFSNNWTYRTPSEKVQFYNFIMLHYGNRVIWTGQKLYMHKKTPGLTYKDFEEISVI